MGFGSVAHYAYACTRVRSRKKFLIKPEEYTRLAEMDSTSVARFIGESQYKKEIETLSSELSGTELIEMATYLNLATTYQHIMTYCKGEAVTILEIYLSELDMKNLKTILRGVFHRAEAKEIRRNLIPGGRFIERYGERLLSANDVREVVGSLKGSIYYAPLSKVLEKNPEVNTLIFLEDALDIAYYSYLLDSLKGKGTSTELFRVFIAREIDMKNLITLMQVKMEEEMYEGVEVAPRDIIIPGGKELSTDVLLDLYSSPDLKHLFGALEKYSFHEAIELHIEGVLEGEGLNELVGAIERHHLSQVARFASRYPLSILPIVHYLVLKKEEVDNLRIIARGKERGLEPDMIKRLVIT